MRNILYSFILLVVFMIFSFFITANQSRNDNKNNTPAKQEQPTNSPNQNSEITSFSDSINHQIIAFIE